MQATIMDRAKAPTPKFFRKLRNIALVLTAVSGAVLTAPVALPAALVTGAGYLAVAGGIAAAVSQLTSNPCIKIAARKKKAEQGNDTGSK